MNDLLYPCRVILMIALYKSLDIATCVVILFLMNLSFFLLLYSVKKVLDCHALDSTCPLVQPGHLFIITM